MLTQTTPYILRFACFFLKGIQVREMNSDAGTEMQENADSVNATLYSSNFCFYLTLHYQMRSLHDVVGKSMYA